MRALFDDLQEGLLQSIDFASGRGFARTITYKINPVISYNKDQIREIRMNSQMSQHTFSDNHLHSSPFISDD